MEFLRACVGVLKSWVAHWTRRNCGQLAPSSNKYVAKVARTSCKVVRTGQIKDNPLQCVSGFSVSQATVCHLTPIGEIRVELLQHKGAEIQKKYRIKVLLRVWSSKF